MDTHPDPELQHQLLSLARSIIDHGCTHGTHPDIDADSFPAALQEPGCCFVTLHKDGQLRGCIGSLEPRRTLIDDITANAFSSAFNDPRFNPVSAKELPSLDIEISVLSSLIPIDVDSENALLAELKPEQDGLLIESGHYRATFLPQVWEQLPNPKDFLLHLKRKAGMPDNLWPEDIRCYRYHCFKFSE
ncbi:AmmeMemoRadiSam system protein A [Spongorhabdus nitratireducens]